MAATGLSFASQMDAWARETEQRATAIFRQSTQETVSRIQSRVPIDLGFARASVMASTSAMPPIVKAKNNQERKPSSDGGAIAQVVAVIATAQLGETIRIGWTAAYMLPLEYGHSKQAPMGFVGITAREWPQIVASVTERAKARVASNPPQSGPATAG